MLSAQITAGIIFVVMFALIVSEKIERHIVSLGCGLFMMVLVFGFCMHSGEAVLETLNTSSIFTVDFWYHTGAAGGVSTGINWETILFIAGMMVMVEGMGHAGFFRWLCLCIAKAVRYKAIPIFITFMLMSFGLSMFIHVYRQYYGNFIPGSSDSGTGTVIAV